MKPAAFRLNPRKSPVQARSTVTVDALHAATLQVLIREGLAGCSTTRIAERAGTSVGTLYQYYPNRDALLAAVLERHLNAIAAAVGQACRQHHGNPLSRMASAFALSFISAKLSRTEESRALYAVAADRGGASQANNMRGRIITEAAVMLSTASDARISDPATVAAIALDALMGPIQTYLRQPASCMTADQLQIELADLITAYFKTRSLPLAAPLLPRPS